MTPPRRSTPSHYSRIAWIVCAITSSSLVAMVISSRFGSTRLPLRDIYGVASDSVAFTQSVEAEKELGHLTVTLSGIKEHALVELLDKGDLVLATQRAHPVTSTSGAKGRGDSLPSSTLDADPVLQSLIKKQLAGADSLASPHQVLLPKLRLILL